MAKVRLRVVDGVAVVTLDAPPVNALSAEVRTGLWNVLDQIETNTEIRAAVLMAAGRMFSAGADIREFDQPMARPGLPDLCNRVEQSDKPVIALAQGQALGGGAELLLAAHYRLATLDARIGLPEVALGLVPGAGGTQRLPRLIGAEAALHMLISTTALEAPVANRLRLVDQLVPGDPLEGALAFARRVIAEGGAPRPTRATRRALADGRAFAASVAKARGFLKGNPLQAPHRVVDCVEAAGLLPFDAGLAFEADAFERCAAHPQSLALRHVFVAERRVDDALLRAEGGGFKPVDPMGKSVILRLRKALRAAADHLVGQGAGEAEVDGAMVAYGFRKGPYGAREAGPATAQSVAIASRLVAALLVEGAACVESEAVQRPSDVDALAVHGLGFPRRMGGPFRAAQTAGLIALRKELRVWVQENEAIWRVPEILDQAIKVADGFDAMNRA